MKHIKLQTALFFCKKFPKVYRMLTHAHHDNDDDSAMANTNNMYIVIALAQLY